MISIDRLYERIGASIRVAREQSKLTQDQLAERVGLTRASISNIENGKQKIQIHSLYLIANALGVSAQVLLPTNMMRDIVGIEEHIPQSFLPEEREWVKQVLALQE